jgi:hypothetical protein
MKKAWMAICPAFSAMAKMSALGRPSALIAWLPWMKVAARSRSRSMAARSKSSASAASPSAPRSRAAPHCSCRQGNPSPAHQFAIRRADPVDARRAAPLDLVEQAGPVAAAKKLSVQDRSRNSFCSALIVVFTEPALAKGP